MSTTMLALQVKSYKHNDKGGYDEYTMGLFNIKYGVLCKNVNGCAVVSGVLLDVDDFNDRYETLVNTDYHFCQVDVVNVTTHTSIVDVSYVERPKGEM